jgi:predicted AlkP superfamily pyrophosphatase or phosphodiesterase
MQSRRHLTRQPAIDSIEDPAMPRNLRLALPLALLAGLALAPQAAVLAAPLPAKPRLVVLISIDQFRADYLRRFEDLFLPPATKNGVGGFRYLTERGAYHTDAHHDHFPTYTGPGHSILLTGATPYLSGIVGNDWFDRDLGRERYCVEDPESPLVGTTAKREGVSPTTLRVTTVGDELKMATGGQAKVWGIALKDRAAVLMAGHLPDGVLWFDGETGAWISSRYYRKDGSLPKWVADWNGAKKIDSFFGQSWKPTAPKQAFARVWNLKNEFVSASVGLGSSFGETGHPITGGLDKPGRDFYRAFTQTPLANEYVLDSALELLAQEKLGQDSIPDILAINLSSNDYIGHTYGPDSAEVLDVTFRTDRALSAFFNALGRKVPGGLASVTIVLSADHGVAPVVGETQRAGFHAGAYVGSVLQKLAEDALDAAFGPADWVLALSEDNLYLNLDTLKAKGVEAANAEAAAAGALATSPGIYAAYTREAALHGQLPQTEIGRRIARSFHPRRSGEVMIVPEPFWVPEGLTGATHGTPYSYDTSVPVLLAGAGIRPGVYTQRVSTLDIAPTLSYLLGILNPSGCEGRVLSHAVR